MVCKTQVCLQENKTLKCFNRSQLKCLKFSLLCSILSCAYYVQNYAGIIGWSLPAVKQIQAHIKQSIKLSHSYAMS